MSNFLDFLNTASLDELTLIPGISRSLAANVIAARPFDFVEDCLHVNGMGKNLLGRAQSYFETAMNNSSNRAVVPVPEDSVPVQASIEEKPSFWSRFKDAFENFLRSFLRLLVTVGVIIGIGVVLYYGLPYINEKFMAPVEQNTAQIDKLESEISTLQAQTTEMDSRVGALEKSVEAQTTSLDQLKGMQNTLEEKLVDNNNQALLELKHEIMITRALDMLGRARLYLAQSNFGSAKQDVQSARDLLVELQTETKDPLLDMAIERLDLTLGNLPAFPVVAAGDLEIAWQLLMTGEAPPPVTPQILSTFTPIPQTTGTSTP